MLEFGLGGWGALGVRTAVRATELSRIAYLQQIQAQLSTARSPPVTDAHRHAHSKDQLHYSRLERGVPRIPSASRDQREGSGFQIGVVSFAAPLSWHRVVRGSPGGFGSSDY